jgi:tetratricopeptide (TPR) repeat protein
LNNIQKIFLVSFICLFVLMYFGCETQPTKLKTLEKSRVLTMESTSIENLIGEAKKKLSKDQVALIETIMSAASKDTVRKIENLEMISKQWFEFDLPVISGYYAEEIAKVKNNADSWGIAGTTYIYGLKSTKNEKEKEFAKTRAIQAFEKAISIESNNVSHKINLALCYVEKPDQDNPMKGILMLRELNEKFPKNVSILNQLARLAIKTNQFEKAIQRLNESYSIDNKNQNTLCLLAEAYTLSGDELNSLKFKKLCIEE